jgi:hypothetical protein
MNDYLEDVNTMKTDSQTAAMMNKLFDFFWVYFDDKTAKVVRKNPGRAIPLIREAIQDRSLSKPKLTIYADAMKTAVAYQSLLMKM